MNEKYVTSLELSKKLKEDSVALEAIKVLEERGYRIVKDSQ